MDARDLLDGFEHVETVREISRSGCAWDGRLRVKLGIDPTSPDLHLGFMVVLHQLAALCRGRHRVTLIIGDFTARIGDPSGRNVTRPQLSREEIEANMQTYREQAGKVLDLERIEVRYNSEWLDAALACRSREAARKNDGRADARAQRLSRTLRCRHADLAARVSLSGRASVRFRRDRGRRRARRDRSALQPAAGAPVPARVRPAAADLRDGSAARRARRREEDEQVARQLRRRRGAAERTVRKADEDSGRADSQSYARLAAFRSPAECRTPRRRPGSADALNPMEEKKRVAEDIVARYHGAGRRGSARASISSGPFSAARFRRKIFDEIEARRLPSASPRFW